MKPLILFVGLAALGCGGGDEDGGGGAETGADADVETGADASGAATARYEHPLFEDPADCPDDPLYNCTPVLELCADGKAVMLVTDIVNTGTYERAGDVITSKWDVGDVPSDIVFAVSEGGQVLTDDWRSWEWTFAEDDFSFCN